MVWSFLHWWGVHYNNRNLIEYTSNELSIAFSQSKRIFSTTKPNNKFDFKTCTQIWFQLKNTVCNWFWFCHLVNRVPLCVTPFMIPTSLVNSSIMFFARLGIFHQLHVNQRERSLCGIDNWTSQLLHYNGITETFLHPTAPSPRSFVQYLFLVNKENILIHHPL